MLNEHAVEIDIYQGIIIIESKIIIKIKLNNNDKNGRK